MTSSSESQWETWLANRAVELEVPSGKHEFNQLLDLTREIAHRFERPAAPLSCFLAGYALAKGTHGDLEAIIAKIEKHLPEAEQ